MAGSPSIPCFILSLLSEPVVLEALGIHTARLNGRAVPVTQASQENSGTPVKNGHTQMCGTTVAVELNIGVS